MLQSFRDNLKGVTAFILVGILIIPFAFFGVESLFVSGSAVEEAATVNGAKISRLDVDRGIDFQKQRMLSQFEDMDPTLLDNELLRAPVLDQLIRQKVLSTVAAAEGMAIPDQTFNQIILATEAFQTGGKFDEALYQYHLSRLGYTPLEYRQSVKEELLASHIGAGIHATAFATDAELRTFGELALQERSFDYVTLDQGEVTDVEVTEADIESYYRENSEQLSVPDQVVVEYIELTPELLLPRVEVAAAEIDARMQEARKASENAGQTWQLAHILVDAEGDDKQQTEEAIEQGLAEGVAFAELAQQYSADFGSAESGGDLGTFTAEAMPPGFAEVVNDLQPGEVAGPVELESGTHFIKLLRASDARVADIALTREKVEAQLRAERARQQLPALVERLKEETFSVDSLATVGEVLELPVKVSQPFAAEGGGDISRYPAIVEAAFSPDVLEEGFASEVIALGENHHAVIKVKDFVPAHLPPLAELSDQIREIVAVRKAQAAVKQRGEALLAAVKSGESLPAAAGEQGLTVRSESAVTRFDQRVPPALSAAVFRLPLSASLPAHGMTTTTNGDAVVYAVTAITPGAPGELSAEERRGMRLSLAQLGGGREFGAFVEALQARSDISRRDAAAGE